VTALLEDIVGLSANEEFEAIAGLSVVINDRLPELDECKDENLDLNRVVNPTSDACVNDEELGDSLDGINEEIVQQVLFLRRLQCHLELTGQKIL